MQMQIWNVYVSEGVMDAIHGGCHSVYEGFVPELNLTINHMTHFVHEDVVTRYQPMSSTFVEMPDPILICEIELSRAQIEDLKILADSDSPEERIRKLIVSTLKERDIDNTKYEDYDDD